MKKARIICLVLALCISITACAGESKKETTATEPEQPSTQAPMPSEETKPVSYTYQVENMQSADCTYYGPDDYVPNTPDPSKFQGKIVVWTQCPKCGEDNIGVHTVDPTTLDFSAGDTVIYSDTDSCFDCEWDYDMEQFMWSIRVTRIVE